MGALAGGALADRVERRIGLYAAVELAIALFGSLSLWLLEFLGVRTAGSPYALALVYVAAFFCVPTFLMGATLPILTKIFNQAIRDFLATVSTLYFLNTIGAALGALLGSYLLISFFGLDLALYVAVATNFMLAALIFYARSLAGESPASSISLRHEPLDPAAGSLGRAAFLVVFLTGFLAIGYEIVWFRVIEILTKNSPYSFSTVLAVYLLGIALGSYLIRRWWRRLAGIHKRDLFFALQFAIGAYVLVAFAGYFYLTEFTPLSVFTRTSFRVPIHPSIPYFVVEVGSARELIKNLWGTADIFLWPAFFVFVPTLCMGATFPLVSLLALSHRESEGSTVGAVYFFSISGNVLGGLATGFVLLGTLGTELALLLFAATGLSFGAFVSRWGNPVRRVVAVGVLVLLAISVFPQRGQLYVAMHPAPEEAHERHFEEGMDAVVMSYAREGKVSHFITGLPHGRYPAIEAYFEIGELAAAAKRAKNALLIGYGAGNYLEGLLGIPGLERVTLVELSGTAIRNLRKIRIFDEMLEEPRVNVVIDDGRRYLLQTSENFDLIVMDPLHPKSAYSNNIYSREFFGLVRAHLNPSGMFLVFNGNNRVLARTVLDTFAFVEVYDYFCLASDSPFASNAGQRDGLLERFSAEELRNVSAGGESFLWSAEAAKAALADAPINRDRKPVAEYFLGIELTGGSLLSPSSRAHFAAGAELPGGAERRASGLPLASGALQGRLQGVRGESP